MTVTIQYITGQGTGQKGGRMTDEEIIEMLMALKSGSYSGNPIVARNFTIIRDYKKESFDFVINEAIKAIKKKGR